MNNETVNSVTKIEAVQLRFGGFEALPAAKGEDRVESPQFTCFGHQWLVRLYPGGHSSSDEGKVAVYLRHCSSGSIEVEATFTVAESKTKCAAYFALSAAGFQAAGHGDSSWGTHNFVKRSTIIVGALQDGALVLDVQLKRTEPEPPLPFVPSPLSTTILKKFRDEESADVVFEVTENICEKEMVRVFPFYAHRFVLPANGALAEACELSEGMTPIRITDVKPSIFRHLLLSLYGGEVTDTVLKENAKEIIDAADKFGVVGLKLAAEVAFVSATTLTIDDVLDNLLYADAKNCALLKEAAIDFLVENGKEAYKQLSFQDVPGSVVADVLMAVSRGKDECNTSSGSGDLSIARVSALRKMLNEKGLDVDGSREAMIARLEENSSD